MSVVEKYIPLIDELVTRNPIAVRLNVLRLGLGDDSFQLSRQSLMVSIAEWQKRTNANEQDVANMIREVLSVETALHQAATELTNLTPQKENKLPDWVVYATAILLILGVFTAIIGGFKLIQKVFS